MKFGINQVGSRQFGIGGLLAMIVFGLVTYGAGFVVNNLVKIDPSWVKLDGQVISYRQSRSADNNAWEYTPQLRYVVNGKIYTLYDTFSTNYPPAIGSSKPIAYDPANPAKSKVVHTGLEKNIGRIFMAISPLWIIAGITFLAISLMRRSSSNNNAPPLPPTQPLAPSAPAGPNTV